MAEELELQKCIFELENSFNKAIGFLRTCSGSNSILELRKYLEEATHALNAVSELREKKNLNVTPQDDVHIDEYSDNDLQQSEDEWGENDDFGDMIKACEDAEQSMNCIDDTSDNEKSFESEVQLEEPEKESEDKCPSVPESFDCDPPTEAHLRVLKQFFGHSSFRPMQWKILRAVLEEKRDVSAVMATGYGKSLCYQYPAVYLNKPVVVISPLISLMEDQVMSLNVANIAACFLGSAQPQKAKVEADVLLGKYKVVYMTPEYVKTPTGDSLLTTLNKNIGVSLFAIDESHCVSHWGHDFRSDYRKLGSLRSKFNHVPFIAVTATATPTVQDDISSSLKLKNPLRVVSSFDRPNLFLEVCMKSPSFENDILRIMTKTNGKLGFSGPTIIYCPTRAMAENIQQKLSGMNIRCQKYHAGLSPEQRKEAHKDFVYDKVEVIAATVAFGMGIDKPDVRRIIHYGAPKDIEAYYQEIGRAGRDGLPSICQVLYSNADFMMAKFFLKDCKSDVFYQHRSDMISKMQQYLNTTQCRRQMLLSHFAGPDVQNYKLSDKCCDNCKKKLKRSKLSNGVSQQDQDGKKDFSAEAKMLFEAIIGTGGSYGLTVPVYIVRGSANQRITDSMKKSKSYGKGKHRSEQWWKALGRLLLCEKYLQEQKPNFGSNKRFSGATVNVTPKAKQWLEKVNQSSTENVSLILEMNAEMTNLEEAKDAVAAKLESIAAVKAALSPVPTSSKKVPRSPDELQELKTLPELEDEVELDPVEEELKATLYKQLMSLRNSLADNDGIAPYMVFSNKNLLDIAVHRPTSLQSMSQIEGITSARISKFGDPMIKLVSAFCKENNMKEDVFNKREEKTQISGVNKSDHHLIYQLNSSAQMTYTLFEIDGKDAEQVQNERKLASSTIAGHLAEAIKIGLPVRLKGTGVTQEMLDIVKKVITSPPINFDISRLTPIKQLCPDYIGFDHLKIILAVFQRDINDMKKEKEETPEGSSVDLKDQNNKETQNHSQPEKDTSDTSEISDSHLKRKDVPSVQSSTMKKIKSNKLFKL